MWWSTNLSCYKSELQVEFVQMLWPTTWQIDSWFLAQLPAKEPLSTFINFPSQRKAVTGVWSWQEQNGREETGGGFSVALNIFFYCDMCSMRLCLHVNQGERNQESGRPPPLSEVCLQTNMRDSRRPPTPRLQPWGEVRPAAGRLHAPRRRSAARLADSVFLSLGEERHSWLAANGFVCFYWQYLANERMNSCWAGCLLMWAQIQAHSALWWRPQDLIGWVMPGSHCSEVWIHTMWM